ncbi:MAG: hypothetical protein ABEJ77_01600 [Halanaeroarchaeum sp.]
MNTTTILGVALLALVATTGFAAASGGVGPATDATTTDGAGDGPGTGIAATDVDRPLDGSNSPWVTGDERLAAFQERFDLTDRQVAEIRSAVQAELQDGASPEAVRETVRAMLESFGVTDPTLGPPADGGQGRGPFGAGTGPGGWAGASDGGVGGPAGVGGPHGPADGSCVN